MSLVRAFSIFSANATGETNNHQRSFNDWHDTLLFALLCVIGVAGTAGTFYGWYRMFCYREPTAAPFVTSVNRADIEQPQVEEDEKKEPLLQRTLSPTY